MKLIGPPSVSEAQSLDICMTLRFQAHHPWGLSALFNCKKWSTDVPHSASGCQPMQSLIRSLAAHDKLREETGIVGIEWLRA
jgi:hypothetical protein